MATVFILSRFIDEYMPVVKRVGILSLARIMAFFPAVVGLIVGIIVALIAIVIGSLAGLPLWIRGIGILAVIVFPIIGAIIGFIHGAIVAFLYNIAADFVGGIELEFQQ